MAILMDNRPRRLLVKVLLDVPTKVFDHIETAEMYDFIELLNWMQVDVNATVPIAKYIVCGTVKLWLPAAKFSNVSGREYMLIDQLYQKWKDSHFTDAQVESEMIAILCRPFAHNDDPSDKRVPFKSKAQTERWIDLVKNLPPSVRLTVLYLISANRKFIADVYGHWLFEQPSTVTDGETEENNTPESDGMNFGYMGMFLDIAQDGVFGDYERVLDTSIHTLFAHQVRKVDQYRKEKQRMDHQLAQSKSR